MCKNSCKIEFLDSPHSMLVLPAHSPLAEHLSVQNSPVLFGCRTGICGTCLVEIEGELPPPNRDEQEILDMLASGNSQARLACQIDLACDVKIRQFVL